MFSRMVTKFQTMPGQKTLFFQIPGVFQDQGQIQGLFEVCANPECVFDHEILSNMNIFDH